MDLVEEIYKLTHSFPDSEKFGLSFQMRRCAVSIPSNISEGVTRSSEKETIHFLYVSLGSASELETQLFIAERLKYLTDIKKEISILTAVKQLLSGLIRHYKNKISDIK